MEPERIPLIDYLVGNPTTEQWRHVVLDRDPAGVHVTTVSVELTADWLMLGCRLTWEAWEVPAVGSPQLAYVRLADAVERRERSKYGRMCSMPLGQPFGRGFHGGYVRPGSAPVPEITIETSMRVQRSLVARQMVKRINQYSPEADVAVIRMAEELLARRSAALDELARAS